MSNEVDMVNHPPHYQPMKGIDFDCIQVARGLTFAAGNAVKHMWRTDRKNGLEDVRKALWYIKDAEEHVDPIYSGPRSEWYLTNELLQRVSIATEGSRSMFFEAVRLRNLVIARLQLELIIATMEAS